MSAPTLTRHDRSAVGAGSLPRFGSRELVRLVVTGAKSVGKTRLQTSGVPFYLMVWVSFPVFNMLLIALIYRGDAALRNYAVVAGAGMALLFGMQFNAAEILDSERQRGTLGNLFVTPAPRYAWLGGFQLFSMVESLLTALVSVSIGAAIFGLPLHLQPVTLFLALGLFMSCLWGFAMVVGAIGLALRNANQLSNLLFPIVQLVAGTLYPMSVMPQWVSVPAHLLPFGYGISAVVGAVTADASPTDVGSDLLALSGFAVVLPALGILAFRLVERRARRRGSLELV